MRRTGENVGPFIKKLLRSEAGATAVEYGLIVALIVIAIIGSVQAVADKNTGLWAVVSSKVNEAM